MLTLKFGGTSMGDADHIIDSANIIVERAEKDRLSVVASAVAEISNSLQASIESCISGSSADNFVSDIKEKHLLICNELENKLDGFSSKDVMAKLEPLFETITIPGTLDNDAILNLNSISITIEAHAIQATGFANADEAWAAFSK